MIHRLFRGIVSFGIRDFFHFSLGDKFRVSALERLEGVVFVGALLSGPFLLRMEIS